MAVIFRLCFMVNKYEKEFLKLKKKTQYKNLYNRMVYLKHEKRNKLVHYNNINSNNFINYLFN